jgi:hypothetical protein
MVGSVVAQMAGWLELAGVAMWRNGDARPRGREAGTGCRRCLFITRL